MQFDLVDPEIAEPRVALLAAQIGDAFTRLERHVGRLSQEEFDYRGPDGDRNSISDLVAHLAYVDLTFLFLMKGRPLPEELEAEYGPYWDADGRIPRVSGRTPAEAAARYRRVQDLLRDYLLSLKEADLTHVFRAPWNGNELTVRYTLWHMAEHSIWHQAQMQQRQREYQSASAQAG